MINYYFKSFIFYLRRQIPFILFYVTTISLLFVLSEFLFYRMSTIENAYGSLESVGGVEYHTINILFIESSSIQAYVFSFVFFAILLCLMIIIECLMTYKRDYSLIVLLKVKGMRSHQTNYLIFAYKVILFAISIGFSLIICAFLNTIICAFLNIKIGCLVFVIEMLYLIIGSIILYLIINFIRLKTGFSHIKMIDEMRKIY